MDSVVQAELDALLQESTNQDWKSPTICDRIADGVRREFEPTDIEISQRAEIDVLKRKILELRVHLRRCKNVKNAGKTELNAKISAKRVRLRAEIESYEERIAVIEAEMKGQKV